MIEIILGFQIWRFSKLDDSWKNGERNGRRYGSGFRAGIESDCYDGTYG